MEYEFFREIDFPDALELITEKFDNAVNLIGSNGVVYGGAIRDLIAGFPLSSDLDIACNYSEHKYIVKTFDNSEKWIRGNFKPQKSDRVPNPFGKKEEPPFLRSASRRKGPYGESSPISSVVDFYNCDGMKVQLMRPSIRPDGLGPATEVVKGVDITCCGLMMDAAGRIFEVIEGAYRDCNDRVLRLNDRNPNVDVEALKKRIKKLEERGWISKINMRKLVRNAKKLEESKRKHMQKLMKENKKRRTGVLGRVDWARLDAPRKRNIFQFSRDNENFIVKVFRRPLSEHLGTGISIGSIDGMLREAAQCCDLSGATDATPDWVKVAFPMQKMMSHQQMSDFETELGDIIENCRMKITEEKKMSMMKTAEGKRPKWKKIKKDAGDFVELAKDDFVELAKKAVKSPKKIPTYAHKHSEAVYEPVSACSIPKEVKTASTYMTEPIASEDIPADMSPAEPPAPEPTKPKRTKRTKKFKGGIVVPAAEKDIPKPKPKKKEEEESMGWRYNPRTKTT